MPSPRKKTSKRKEKSGRPPTTPENGGKRQYRKFSPATKTKKLRNRLIDDAADEGIEVKRKNLDKNGKPRQQSKWVKDKVNFLKQRCEALKITYDDIMNRIRSKEKKEEEAEKEKKNPSPSPSSTSTAPSPSPQSDTNADAVTTAQLSNKVSPSDLNPSPPVQEQNTSSTASTTTTTSTSNQASTRFLLLLQRMCFLKPTSTSGGGTRSLLYRRMSVQSPYGMPDELPTTEQQIASWNALLPKDDARESNSV